jgi:Domain of unknown function (DUF929)
VPVGTALQLVRALPDTRLQLAEGAGHHLRRRIQDVAAEAIAAFLTKLERSAVRDAHGCEVNIPQVLSVIVGGVIHGRTPAPGTPEDRHTGGTEDQVTGKSTSQANGRSARRLRGAGAKARARERIAAERARRKRAEARRRLLVPAGAVTAVLAIVVALVAVKLTSPHPTASESPAPASVIRQVMTVPDTTLTRVSAGQPATPLQAVRAAGPPLTIDGKPAIVFISEESCPFCAAERWPLTVALSRFGAWSHLGFTTSSATDVYPSTATLSFRAARYASPDLTLRTTELTDNLGRPLQAQTALNTRLIGTYDVPPYVNSADQSGAVPFLDIANRYILAGAQYSPQVLAGLSQAQIAAQLHNPSSPVAKAIDGSASVIIAAIDHILHISTPAG